MNIKHAVGNKVPNDLLGKCKSLSMFDNFQFSFRNHMSYKFIIQSSMFFQYFPVIVRIMTRLTRDLEIIPFGLKPEFTLGYRLQRPIFKAF